MAMAIDTIQGDAEGAQVASDAEPATGPEPEAGEAADGQEGQPAGGDNTEAIIGKYRGEIARLARVVQDRQAENAQLKAEREQASAHRPGTVSLEPATLQHEALKGLTTEEGLVHYKGAWVAPEFVIDQWELRNEVSELKQARAQAAEREQAVKTQAKINETFQTIEKVALKVCAEKYPGVADGTLQEVASDVLGVVDDIVTPLLAENGLDIEAITAEQWTQFLHQGFDTITRRYGRYGQLQIADNDKHKNDNKVKPGGTPAVPAQKNVRDMTRAELESMSREAARTVERSRPTG